MLKEFYSPQLAGGGKLEKARPMLKDPNYWAQEKLDGCRYILHYGVDGEVKVYSRRTSDVTGLPVLKTDRVPHLVAQVRDLVPKGTVLDGEIITIDPDVPQDGRSAYVTSIIGSSAEEAARKQERYALHFAAFDILAWNGQDIMHEPLIDRYNRLVNRIPMTTDEGYIYLLDTTIGSEAIKEHFLKEIWDRGGEGIILKDHRAPYMEGSRSRAWTKVKEQLEFDCIVMGFEDAKEESEKVDGTVSETKYKGQVGKVVFGQYNGAGDLVEIGKASGFTDAIRRDMTDNPSEWLGKVIVIRAHQQLPSGKLRHPRTSAHIRTDKDPKDCVILGELGG